MMRLNSFYTKSTYIFGTFFLLLVLTSCQLTRKTDLKLPVIDRDLSRMRTLESIYVQSVTGFEDDEFELERIIEYLDDLDLYDILEDVPDEIDGIAALNLKKVELLQWEEEEYSGEVKTIRRNIILKVQASLKMLKTAEELLRLDIEAPYQQIYIGEKAIENMPSLEKEEERLTDQAFKQFIEYIDYQTIEQPVEFETGKTNSIIGLFSPGNKVIEKGIRLAETEKYLQARLTWASVTFEPETKSSEAFFRFNRAAAFYNIGILFQLENQWLKAAKMFSSANQMMQKEKYADAWSNAVVRWKSEMRNRKPDDSPTQTITRQKKKAAEQKPKPWRVPLKPEYQLKIQKLWPYDKEMIEFSDYIPLFLSPSRNIEQNNGITRPNSQVPDSSLAPLDLGN